MDEELKKGLLDLIRSAQDNTLPIFNTLVEQARLYNLYGLIVSLVFLIPASIILIKGIRLANDEESLHSTKTTAHLIVGSATTIFTLCAAVSCLLGYLAPLGKLLS